MYLLVITKIKTNMQMKDTKRDAIIDIFDCWSEIRIERLIN